MRFFEPQNIGGKTKLVDINTGDFFAFETEEEIESTKRILTGVLEDVENFADDDDDIILLGDDE